MAAASLAAKMKLRPGARAAIIGAPDAYFSELNPRGVDMSIRLEGQFDWIQIFVKSKADLEALIPQVIPTLKPESMLWISFPKGTSKIQTDLTRDKGWDSVRDLKWINLISVNDTWSAFALRPYKPGEARQSFR